MKTKLILDKICRIDNEEINRREYIRLDKNEGFIKFSNKFLEKCKTIITSDFLNSYPQPYMLRNALAKYLGINENELYLGSGSDAVIKSVFEIIIDPGDEVILPTPNYAMYYVYSELFQAKIKKINYSNLTLSVNVDEIISQITSKTKIIFISNPNSPVGDLITESNLLKIIKVAEKKGVIVFIDEAYYPFSNFTMIKYFRKFDNIIISRTFSKAFSLASVRLGYVIAQSKIIEYFKKVRPIYEINSFAEKMGILILKELSFEKIYSDFIKIKRYVISRLKKLNIDFIDTQANFIHLKIDVAKQKDLMNYMFENKIILKKTGNKNFLDDYIRISISNRNNMEMFLNKLGDFANEK